MSQTVAYVCDYADHLMPEEAIFGLSSQEDMIDMQLSYPVVKSRKKADVHICTDCWNKNVLEPARNTFDRRNNDEAAYKLVLKGLAYDFRKTAVMRWIRKKRFSHKS